MNKSKLFIGVLALFFVIVITMSVFTLSLNAGGGLPEEPGGGTGKWADVCCGPMCPGGIDYCIGTGSYICCK